MTLTNILIGAGGVLFFLIALAIAVHHEIEGRRRDAAAARAWVRREFHNVLTPRPLHFSPRHNRGALYEDLSLTRFEKDQDDGR